MYKEELLKIANEAHQHAIKCFKYTPHALIPYQNNNNLGELTLPSKLEVRAMLNSYHDKNQRYIENEFYVRELLKYIIDSDDDRNASANLAPKIVEFLQDQLDYASLYIITKQIWDFGRCGERGHSAYFYLLKHPFLQENNTRVESVGVETKNGSHQFILLDRAEKSNIKDRKTWGDKCLYLDTYRDQGILCYANEAPDYSVLGDTLIRKQWFVINDNHEIAVIKNQFFAELAPCPRLKEFCINKLTVIEKLQTLAELDAFYGEKMPYTMVQLRAMNLDQHSEFSGWSLCDINDELSRRKMFETICALSKSMFNGISTPNALDQTNKLETLQKKYQTKNDVAPPSVSTAFRRAAYKGDYDDVDFLLKHIDNIDEPTSEKAGKKTALYLAAENSHVAIVRLLLMHGAIDQPAANGNTAEAIAKAGKNKKLISCFQVDAVSNGLSCENGALLSNN